MCIRDRYRALTFEWCFRNQLSNDPEVWTDLASLYLHGEGVEENIKLAYFWYEKAASADHAPAMFQLARLYEDGNGCLLYTSRCG